MFLVIEKQTHSLYMFDLAFVLAKKLHQMNEMKSFAHLTQLWLKPDKDAFILLSLPVAVFLSSAAFTCTKSKKDPGNIR